MNIIYIGGGTPSLFGADFLRQHIQSITPTLRQDTVEEFTIEITPSSADPAFLLTAREAGINRLGLGAHPFDGVRRWSSVAQVEECARLLEAGELLSRSSACFPSASKWNSFISSVYDRGKESDWPERAAH